MHEDGMLKQAPPMVAKEELPPGRRIFELIENYGPEVQRQALDEAEKLIHERFDQRLCQIKEEAESISKQWEIFKGNG